jgi:hypothetical protein
MLVVDDRVGHVADPPPCGAQPPGQVGVLVVQEERGVEATHPSGVVDTQYRCAAAECRDVDRFVVRWPVRRAVSAVVADPPSVQCAAGVVHPAVLGQQQPAGDSGQRRVGIQVLDQGGKPSGIGDGVVVEERRVRRRGGIQAGLRATGEPCVRVKPDHTRLGIACCEQLGGPVCGRVVHYENAVWLGLYAQ